MWPENCSGWPEHRQKEGNTDSGLALTFDDLWDFLEKIENVTVNYKRKKGKCALL